MALITLNNKSVIIESATYDGKTYEGSELVALIDKLKVHLNAISDDIDLNSREFTVYRDRVESNGKSVSTHPTEYERIVDKTKRFVYSSPQSPLSQSSPHTGIDPEVLREKLIPLAAEQKANELKCLFEENQQLRDAICESHLKLRELEILLKDSDTKASLNQSKIASLQNELENLRGQLESNVSKTKKKQTQIDELKSSLLELNKNIATAADLKTEKIELHKSLQAAKRQLANQEENLQLQEKAAKEMKESLAKEKLDLSAVNNKLKSELEKYKIDNEQLNKQIIDAKAKKADPKVIEELNDALAKSHAKINEWKIAYKTQEATIAQLNTKLGSFQHDVELLERAAEEKARLHEQILNTWKLNEAALRAQLTEAQAEIRSIISELKAEIERLKDKRKAEEIAIQTLVKSPKSDAEKIEQIKTKQSLKLTKDEHNRFKENMHFLENPIRSISKNQVTLENGFVIDPKRSKIAREIISKNNKFKGNVIAIPDLNPIDKFVGSQLKKKYNTKDLLVQNGDIVPKLMAFEFLSRNQKIEELKKYNESINDVRLALITLKDRIAVEVAS
ncbi:MAG: hypothetical protein KDK50_04950 [Chlamydiia bacterium]|nr:hypothetical protein [Chlamydiia bacterium]